jgi:hypothetical protein
MLHDSEWIVFGTVMNYFPPWFFGSDFMIDSYHLFIHNFHNFVKLIFLNVFENFLFFWFADNVFGFDALDGNCDFAGLYIEGIYLLGHFGIVDTRIRQVHYLFIFSILCYRNREIIYKFIDITQKIQFKFYNKYDPIFQ